MAIFNRRLSISLDGEVVAAGCLILLFSGWLLLNFIIGFNLPLYVMIATVGLIVSIVRPRAAFYALTFLTLIFAKFFTLQSLLVNQVAYKFYLVDILFAGILVGLLLRLAKGRLKIKLQWPEVMLAVWLLLVGGYFILSVVSWQGAFALSFSSFKNYAFYPLFYVAAYLLINNRQRLKIWLTLVAAGVVGIFGFIIYGLINGRGLWTEITPLSTAGSRILDFDHAFYLCLAVLAGLAYLVFKKGAATRWLYVFLPLAAVGIIGSLMRHLWLALAAALVSFYWLLAKRERPVLRRVLVNYGLAAMMLAVAVIFVVNVLPFSRLSRTYQTTVGDLGMRAASLANVDDSSIAWRSAVWTSVWSEYKDNIFGGLGFGQKVFIDLGNYRDYVEVRNVHNSWLAIFAQLGLVGLALLTLFGWGVWWKLLNYRTAGATAGAARSALAAVMIFCVVAFLFQPYLEANWFSIPFWLALGLAKRTYEGAFG